MSNHHTCVCEYTAFQLYSPTAITPFSATLNYESMVELPCLSCKFSAIKKEMTDSGCARR